MFGLPDMMLLVLSTLAACLHVVFSLRDEAGCSGEDDKLTGLFWSYPTHP